MHSAIQTQHPQLLLSSHLSGQRTGAVAVSLEDFFRSAPMSDISSKRGEIPSQTGGESPQKRTKSGATPSSKGQGKGKQTGQRRREGQQSEATDDGLVNAVARLVLRHDEQLLALTSDLCYISYVRTDGHSVLQELQEESKRQRSMMAPTSPPRHALTIRFVRALKERVVKVSQSETVQQKLKQEGAMTMHGEWPYLEWSSGSQSTLESLEDPLSTSQLLSGLGDVISHLEADSTQVAMFKTSRPISDKMTGGPVRLLFQFSCKVGTTELLDTLGTLANNSAFSLLNGDFQKQGAQPSPLVKQIRNMLR